VEKEDGETRLRSFFGGVVMGDGNIGLFAAYLPMKESGYQL